MRVAAPFAIDNAANNDRIDEFNIIFKEDSSIEKLVEFLELYQEKRVNVCFEHYNPTPYEFKLLNATHENFYVMLTSANLAGFDGPSPEELKDLNIKFFTDKLIGSWTELVNWTAVGVSEIYPAGDLLHNMDSLRKYCDDNNMGIRFILNTVPNYTGTSEDVFFRPQDFDLVEKYFDTVEFVCEASPFDARYYNWSVFKVLHKAWFVKKKWIGDLIEINVDIDYFVPCEAFPSRFFEKKLNCDYGCKKGKSCNSCNLYFEMAHALKEKGLRIAT